MAWTKVESSLIDVMRVLGDLPLGSRVAICGHGRPDGDAVGSTIALALALKARGHHVWALTADAADPPATYRWMFGFELLESVTTAPVEEPLDLFISVDNPHPNRLVLARELCERSRTRILIDHHPDTEPYCDHYLVREDAGATTHVVWDLLGELGWERTPAIATACLVGLMTDTGSFHYSNTSAESLRAAAEMVEAGANPSQVSVHLYESRTPARIELENRVLSRLTVANGGAVVYSWVFESDYNETGATHAEGENLSDLIRVVDGAVAAMLIVVSPRGPRVSLRSKTDFDVSAVAAQFGGGGHRAASGVTWPNADDSIDAIVSRLLPLLPKGGTADGAS